MVKRSEVEVVVTGGSQAGLAAAYHLQRRNLRFVVLDGRKHSGDAWRERWDSLRLFTPAGSSHLPGARFPLPSATFATKDQVADYLDAYAIAHDLPLRMRNRVHSLSSPGSLLQVETPTETWIAPTVILATGAHAIARTPSFVDALDPRIAQFTAHTYRSPAQVPGERVLVVGAGNSGAEIALDLSSDPDRWVGLAGRDVGHVPRLALRPAVYPLMRLAGARGADAVARRLAGRGDPLGRVRPGQLLTAAVHRMPRVAGLSSGVPRLVDGGTVDVDSIVWCTGSGPDHSWVHLDVFDDRGGIRQRRGITPHPGLYVLGMPHQAAIGSHLLGGVGADAQAVVRDIGALLRDAG